MRLRDLPDGNIFSVAGEPHKGFWRKLSDTPQGPIVESCSKPRMLMKVNPELQVTRVERGQG